MRDIQMAHDLNVTYISFNYDFWHNWLLTSTVEQIQAAKEKGDLKAWAQGNANLIKAIGDRPPQITDPKLVEKHTFLIQINQLGKTINIDTKELNQRTPQELKEISDSIYTEITEADALEIFET